jgi:hypothetical protein
LLEHKTLGSFISRPEVYKRVMPVSADPRANDRVATLENTGILAHPDKIIV